MANNEARNPEEQKEVTKLRERKREKEELQRRKNAGGENRTGEESKPSTRRAPDQRSPDINAPGGCHNVGLPPVHTRLHLHYVRSSFLSSLHLLVIGSPPSCSASSLMVPPGAQCRRVPLRRPGLEHGATDCYKRINYLRKQ
jgi:hypothetical protein